jgi:hypothetical protein
MARGSRQIARFRAAALAVATGLVLAASPGIAHAAATIYVDGAEPGGPGCGTQANPCRTITEGIAAASAGDTVQVAPGTYTEQLDISKQLNLVGSGVNGGSQNETIVASPSPVGACSSTVLCDKFGGGDNRPVIYVHGTTDATPVNITDLKVAGNGQGLSTFTFYGIVYDNASGRISNVRITHVRDTPADATNTGIGIYNTNSDLGVRTFGVDQSALSDYQTTGILVTGTNLHTNIHENGLAGNGLNALVVQTGISVIGTDSNSLANNIVTNHLCYPPNVVGCGPNLLTQNQAAAIRLTSEGTTTVSGTLTPPLGGGGPSNDVGILDTNSDATRTLTHNVLHANRYAGVFTNDGTVNMTGNDISGALTPGNANAGIAEASVTAAHVPTINLGATPATPGGEGNTVTDSTVGIKVFDDGTSPPVPSLTAHFNRLVRNPTTTGNSLSNSTGSLINAENNWWGCNAGPGNSAGCDNVVNSSTGNVDFNPWLVLKASDTPSELVAGSSGTSAVKGDVTTNSGAVTAGISFPDGVSLAFATDLGSIPSTALTNNGVATSHLSPGGTAGTANPTVSLDNETLPAGPVTIYAAGACANTQTGTSGDDVLNGSIGGDRLLGQGGNDVLNGKGANDCLRGGVGSDRLDGGAGKDRLIGGSDGDLLIGGPGKDRFVGGLGPDVIRAADGISEHINCGRGRDRARVDPSDVTVSCEVLLP